MTKHMTDFDVYIDEGRIRLVFETDNDAWQFDLEAEEAKDLATDLEELANLVTQS